MATAILVTGAAGFVGGAVVRRLVEGGHDVLGMVRRSDQCDLVATLGARPVLGDLLDGAALRGALQGAGAVVHCAGRVGGGIPSAEAFRVNADGAEQLARAMAAAGVPRLLHVSSLRVFGPAPRTGCTENEPFAVTGDTYGDSKIEAERRLTIVARESGLRVQVLRPGHLYGAGDRHFLPALIAALSAGQVRLAGDGDNRLDPLDVDDLAEAVLRLLERDEIASVNLASTEPVTARRLIESVSHACGRSFPIRSVSLTTAVRARAGWGEPTAIPWIVLDVIALDRRLDLGCMQRGLALTSKPFDAGIARAVAHAGL